MEFSGFYVYSWSQEHHVTGTFLWFDGENTNKMFLNDGNF